MQLAVQLRAPWRHEDNTAAAEPEQDEGQRLLPAAGVPKRRCHWRRSALGHKFQAAGLQKRQERAHSAAGVGEQMISNDERKRLAGKSKTNTKTVAKQAWRQQQHEQEPDDEHGKLIINLSHREQMNELPARPLNQISATFLKKRPHLERPAGRAATSGSLGAHLRRLKLPFVLLALLMALAAEAARVSRRSISEGAHANRLASGVSSRDKQAAAELVARQLLTSYYRTKILSQHAAQLGASDATHRAQPQPQAQQQQQQQVSVQPATVNQHNHEQRPQESGLDGSSWTTSSELMPPANSLHERPAQSLAARHQALNAGEHQFVAYQPATAPAGLPVAVNSLGATHEPMQQQQQLTTPTLNKQLPPPAYYEFGLAPTSALQLEPVAASSEHLASVVEAPSLSGQSQRASQVRAPSVDKPQPVESVVRTHAPAASTSARNGRQFNGDQGADASGGESASASSSSSSSSADQSQQDAVPVASVPEKGVEPRQRRRMFNRILKKAEWNHLFVELSKVFVRYFLDLALKDIIGKQSGGTAGSSDSSSASSSSSTSGRKKLDAQSELTDLLKDFVKTAISNM